MPDKPKVLVCGGRDFDDRATVYAKLDRLHADRPFGAMIAGGARGADTLAVEWAKNRGVPFDVYMADWEGLGRSRPNSELADARRGKARLGRGIPRR
jgi:YspA, cpYpsA-related SLOG family